LRIRHERGARLRQIGPIGPSPALVKGIYPDQRDAIVTVKCAATQTVTATCRFPPPHCCYRATWLLSASTAIPPVGSYVMLRSSAVGTQDIGVLLPTLPSASCKSLKRTYPSVGCVVADNYQRDFFFEDGVASPTSEPATCRTTVPGNSLTPCPASVALPAASLSQAVLSSHWRYDDLHVSFRPKRGTGRSENR